MTRRINERRMDRCLPLGLAFVLISGSLTAAQSESSVYHTPTGDYHQPTSLYPVEMGFSQHHSSTLQEGIQRGRAAVIQAQGNYEVNNAQAQILREQARSLARENELKVIQARAERLELRRTAALNELKQREERRATGRLMLAERRATVVRQAYQLSTTEFDRTTGAIRWPEALRKAKYQASRAQIEELFRVHVGYDDKQPGNVKEITRSIASLAKSLRSELGTLPREEYFAAHKFLRGLQQEAATFTSAS